MFFLKNTLQTKIEVKVPAHQVFSKKEIIAVNNAPNGITIWQHCFLTASVFSNCSKTNQTAEATSLIYSIHRWLPWSLHMQYANIWVERVVKEGGMNGIEWLKRRGGWQQWSSCLQGTPEIKRNLNTHLIRWMPSELVGSLVEIRARLSAGSCS